MADFPDPTEGLTSNNGEDITIANAKKKTTYTNNSWLFRDNYEFTGYWAITEDNSFPYFCYTIYNSLTFPSNDQTLSGYDGGDISLADAKKEESYVNNTWDFTTIWIIQEGKYFPRFGWEPPVAEGSRLIIGTDVIPLNIQSLNDNNNISFTENKTNSTSTKSYMTFNGNKRRKIKIRGYTDYDNYELLAEAAENYSKCYTYIYPPLDITENITPYSYYYVTDLKTTYKLGDSKNIYYDIELTFGGHWGDYIPDDYTVFNTSDNDEFYTSDQKRLVVQF